MTELRIEVPRLDFRCPSEGRLGPLVIALLEMDVPDADVGRGGRRIVLKHVMEQLKSRIVVA